MSTYHRLLFHLNLILLAYSDRSDCGFNVAPPKKKLDDFGCSNNNNNNKYDGHQRIMFLSWFYIAQSMEAKTRWNLSFVVKHSPSACPGIICGCVCVLFATGTRDSNHCDCSERKKSIEMQSNELKVNEKWDFERPNWCGKKIDKRKITATTRAYKPIVVNAGH